jgi:hypothetical protein
MFALDWRLKKKYLITLQHNRFDPDDELAVWKKFYDGNIWSALHFFFFIHPLQFTSLKCHCSFSLLGVRFFCVYVAEIKLKLEQMRMKRDRAPTHKFLFCCNIAVMTYHCGHKLSSVACCAVEHVCFSCAAKTQHYFWTFEKQHIDANFAHKITEMKHQKK